jgi:hypothetical protein
MLSLRQLTRRLWPNNALRKFSAAVLAISLLATIAPFSFSSTSSAHSCSMPCCASGACESGACDFSFETNSQKHSHASSHAAAEKLCGAENLLKISVESSVTRLMRKETVKQHSLQPDSFSRPCPPDCGAGTTSQLRRAGELAILGHAHKARPPTHLSLFKSEAHPTFLNARWRRQSKPRAPPSSAVSFIV